MSTENIEAFFKKAESDKELQEKIAGILKGTDQSIPEALAALSVDAELPFTVEEYLNTNNPANELSEDELKNVSGGADMQMSDRDAAQKRIFLGILKDADKPTGQRLLMKSIISQDNVRSLFSREEMDSLIDRFWHEM